MEQIEDNPDVSHIFQLEKVTSGEFATYETCTRTGQCYTMKVVNLFIYGKKCKDTYLRYVRKVFKASGSMKYLSSELVSQSFVLMDNDMRLAVCNLEFPAGNMDCWLNGRAYFNVSTACEIIYGICCAMKFLHDNDITHGNFGFKNVIFRNERPNSLAITLDVSITSELRKTFCVIPIDVEKCPPELLEYVMTDSQCGFDEGQVRTSDRVAIWNALIKGKRELDSWCVGVVAHKLVTGCRPYMETDAAKLLDRMKSSQGKLKHPMLKTFSPSVRGIIQGLLNVNPLERSSVEEGTQQDWFNDEWTMTDDRNLLYITEYNLLAEQYRIQQEYIDLSNRLKDRN